MTGQPAPSPPEPAHRAAAPTAARRHVTATAGSLRRRLEASPSAPLLLIAIALFIWLAADEGGYLGTSFLPATIVLLALLIVGLLALPLPRPSRAQLAAIALIAAYAAWTYLSILWADQQGLALESANRTAMYAIVFALFALWPIGGRTAAGLAAAFALGIAAVGLVELIGAAGASSPIEFFDEGRLSDPTGYANANVALWTMALWPALLLSGRRGMHAAVRGLLLGAAGLLSALAILGQSRGWVVVLPAVVLLVVAIVPGRGRTIAALALVAAAVAAISRPLLNVYDEWSAASSNSAAVSTALWAVLSACGVLVAAGIAWASLERMPSLGHAARRRLGRALVVGFTVCCAAGLVGFAAVRGNPVSAAGDAWSEFTRGGKEPHFEGARLGSLGGTWRYDYWKVAWNEFTQHPLTGVGGDNFGRDYLIHGKSRQTPAYPHSVEIRVLSETGLIGVLLLGGGTVAALIAAAGPIRRARALGAVSAATGVVVFVYFLAHGSLDWFWEFPALGTPAFALLGMSTAIDRRPDPPTRRDRLGRPVLVAGGAFVLALLVALTPPWLAERELNDAKSIAGEDPAAALSKLDLASNLNPLSPLADKTAAVILTRERRYIAAEHRFRGTLGADPGDPFVYLELAAIASARGYERDAVRLIRRARELNPRDAVTGAVRRRLEAGRRVTPAEVEAIIVRDVRTRIGRE